MSRRSNAAFRCHSCRLHEGLCICALVPKLATRTKLVLVIHRSEDRKTTNTGRLATLCLENHEVLIRGHQESPSTEIDFGNATQPVFLFPFEDAVPLADFANSEKPVTLVVPDGTWRQAAKVRKRVPGLSKIPCVSLPMGSATTYRLRSESHEGGLATVEAIARAMGILEGENVQRAIEQIFAAMVERTLWSRGRIETEEVTGGVPAFAMRHDPLSGLARSR